jgi:uncharacterized protein (TIGR02246 family)
MRSLRFAIALSLAAPISIHAQATPPARMPSVTLPAELDRVLRDYERLWKASDAAALAALFTDDGFALSNGKPPVRGRDGIQGAYSRVAGGDLRLRALGHATADTVGYIVGAYAFGSDTTDVGKFVLALRRPRGGAWLIAADIDNSIRRPGGP